MAIREQRADLSPAREEDVFVYRARRRCKVVLGVGEIESQ
jgi:hypothetical protein